MTSRAWMLRLAALLAAGTFALHQARYLLGYGGDAPDALAEHGHAYLSAVGPLIAAALSLALAELARRVARGGSAPAPRLRCLWAAATGALVAVHVVQELVESALAPHHPDGLAAVAGHGGWAALPLALVVGLGVAVAMRGASTAAELARPSRPWRTPRPLAPAATFTRSALPVAARAGAPLALASRGPPAASH